MKVDDSLNPIHQVTIYLEHEGGFNTQGQPSVGVRRLVYKLNQEYLIPDGSKRKSTIVKLEKEDGFLQLVAENEHGISQVIEEFNLSTVQQIRRTVTI